MSARNVEPDGLFYVIKMGIGHGVGGSVQTGVTINNNKVNGYPKPGATMCQQIMNGLRSMSMLQCGASLQRPSIV